MDGWWVTWSRPGDYLKGCSGRRRGCGHGYVTGACGVVSVNGESTTEGTSPVDGDGAEFMEGLDEVVGVLFYDVLDAEVVYDEGEKYGFGVVLPQRRGSGYRGENELV